MKSLLLSFLLFCTGTFLHAQQPGTLDLTFGNKGTFVDSAVADVVGERVMKVTKDGRILIGTGGPYKGFNFTFKIDAYLSNGSHDLSFGENGSAYVVFPDMKTPQDNATISSLALLPDGRILACGTRYAINLYGYISFARFKPDGTIDSTFGTNGTAVDTAFEENSGYEGHGSNSLLIQPDGKLVTAGSVIINAEQFISNVSTARYLPDGNPDVNYGEYGITVGNAIGYASAIALQKDGKIVSAGHSGNISTDGSKFHLERYNTDGSFDKSFGKNGIVDTKIGTGGSFINSVAIQDDGKIVVGETVMALLALNLRLLAIILMVV